VKRRVVVPSLLLVAAMIGIAGAINASADTSGGTANGDALTQARRRTIDHDYSGEIVVRWLDTAGAPHSEEALVRYHDGVVEVGDNGRVVAATRDRLLLDGAAWSTAPTSDVAGAPTLAAKYDIERTQGPAIAGLPTIMYDAVRARDRVLVERFYVDRATGLVLRRESFASNGTVVRSLAFAKVWSSADRAGLSPMSTTSAPSAHVRKVKHVDAPYRAPKHAGNGFQLVARWKHAKSVVQLSYSDGLLSASVFEQPGSLDWNTLPAGGVATTVHGRPAVSYALPIGDAIVWQRGGIVYTCVGDAPREELAALALDVSHPVEDASMIRMARVLLAPFRW
jgi:hypothetical protein